MRLVSWDSVSCSTGAKVPVLLALDRDKKLHIISGELPSIVNGIAPHLLKRMSSTAAEDSGSNTPPGQQQHHSQQWRRRSNCSEVSPIGAVKEILKQINAAERSESDVELLFHVVRKYEFFQSLSAPIRSLVCKNLEYMEREEGAELFHQGDEADAFYLILQGAVGVYVNVENKDERNVSIEVGSRIGRAYLREHEKIVTELSVGDSFGEWALTRNETRTATIRCLSTCDLLVISRAFYSNVLRKSRNYDVKTTAALDVLRTTQPGDRGIHELRLIAEYLRDCQFFVTTPPTTVLEISQTLTSKVFEGGELMIDKGAAAKECYLLCEGKIGIYRDILEGWEDTVDVLRRSKEKMPLGGKINKVPRAKYPLGVTSGGVEIATYLELLYTIKTGEVLGEWALARDGPRMGFAVVVSSCTTICISKRAYLRYVLPLKNDFVRYSIVESLLSTRQYYQRDSLDLEFTSSQILSKGLFEALTSSMRWEISRLLELKHFKAGETITQEGECISRFFCILRGSVGVYKRRDYRQQWRYAVRKVIRMSAFTRAATAPSPCGQQVAKEEVGGDPQTTGKHQPPPSLMSLQLKQRSESLVTTLNRGAITGEWSLLREEISSTSLRAISDCQIAVLTKEDYLEVMMRGKRSDENVQRSCALTILQKKSPICRSNADLASLDLLINQSEVFRGLQYVVRAEICRALEHRALDVGEVLFRQGDVAENFFVILGGTMEVFVMRDAPQQRQSSKAREDRRCDQDILCLSSSVPLFDAIISDQENNTKTPSHVIKVATLGTGEPVGEWALLAEDRLRTAQVVCKTPCELACLTRGAYNRILKGHRQASHTRDMALTVLKDRPAGLRSTVELKCLLDLIKSSTFFENLAEGIRGSVCQHMTFRHFPANVVLFNMGDPSDNFYMILRGCVGVYVPKKEETTTTARDVSGKRSRTKTIIPPSSESNKTTTTKGVSANKRTSSPLLVESSSKQSTPPSAVVTISSGGDQEETSIRQKTIQQTRQFRNLEEQLSSQCDRARQLKSTLESRKWRDVKKRPLGFPLQMQISYAHLMKHLETVEAERRKTELAIEEIKSTLGISRIYRNREELLVDDDTFEWGPTTCLALPHASSSSIAAVVEKNPDNNNSGGKNDNLHKGNNSNSSNSNNYSSLEGMVSVMTLYEGECFGEKGLLDDAKRAATIMTHSVCEFLVVNKESFNEIFASELSYQHDQKILFLRRWIPSQSDVSLSRLSYYFKSISFCTGRVVVSEGKQMESLLLIKDGQVALTVGETNNSLPTSSALCHDGSSSRAPPRVFALQGEGQALGVSCLYGGERHVEDYSAVVISSTLLAWQISKHDLLQRLPTSSLREIRNCTQQMANWHSSRMETVKAQLSRLPIGISSRNSCLPAAANMSSSLPAEAQLVVPVVKTSPFLRHKDESVLRRSVAREWIPPENEVANLMRDLRCLHGLQLGYSNNTGSSSSSNGECDGNMIRSKKFRVNGQLLTAGELFVLFNTSVKKNKEGPLSPKRPSLVRNRKKIELLLPPIQTHR